MTWTTILKSTIFTSTKAYIYFDWLQRLTMQEYPFLLRINENFAKNSTTIQCIESGNVAGSFQNKTVVILGLANKLYTDRIVGWKMFYQFQNKCFRRPTLIPPSGGPSHLPLPDHPHLLLQVDHRLKSVVGYDVHLAPYRSYDVHITLPQTGATMSAVPKTKATIFTVPQTGAIMTATPKKNATMYASRQTGAAMSATPQTEATVSTTLQTEAMLSATLKTTVLLATTPSMSPGYPNPQQYHNTQHLPLSL